MKNKGFTLTELMVVIAIMAIIVLIAIPSIIAINKNINKRVYNQKKETIIHSAEIYAQNNANLFNDSTTVNVYVRELIANNYLSIDVEPNDSNCIANSKNGNNGCLINPIDKTSMNNDYLIIIQKSVGAEVEYHVNNS